MSAFDGILKFGIVNPVGQYYFKLPMGASEVVAAQSGRFVKDDGSGRGEIAGNGDATIMGWVEGNETCSATEGGTTLDCTASPNAVFKIPVRYDNSTYTQNYADSMIGDKVDLVVVSGVQYANLTDSDEDLVIVLGGKAATSATANDGWALVMMNPAKIAEA